MVRCFAQQSLEPRGRGTISPPPLDASASTPQTTRPTRRVAMSPIDRINAAFESWIDPFRPHAGTPPVETPKFFWHFIAQAKPAFAIMLVLGGVVALIEAGLFYFVGRLVDLL